MPPRQFSLAVLFIAGGVIGAQQRSGDDLDKARRLYESALSDSQQNHRRAEILEELAETELALGHYPETVRRGEECAAEPKVSPDRAANCLSTAGQGLLLAGQYGESRTVFLRALEVARSGSLPDAEVSILNNLGSGAYYQGAYAESYRAYEGARSLLEKHQHASWHDRLQKLTLANTAMLYQRVGQLERALAIYRELERNGGELKPSQRAQMLSNIGTLYRRLGDPYKAMKQYQTAEELYRTDHNRDGEIGVMKNTGIALAMDLHEYAAATAAFGKALAMAVDSGNVREAVQARIYLGETFRLSKRFGDAQLSLERALEGATRAALKEERWRALVSLGRVAENSRSPAQALAFYRDAIAEIESLRSTLSVTQLRTTFLADKRDAYDGAIGCLLRAGGGSSPELFRYMEQIRARVLRERTGRGDAQPRLEDVQQRLPADTALLELWRSGETVGTLLITRTSATARIADSLAPGMVERIVHLWNEGESVPDPLAGEVASALLASVRDLPREVIRLIVAPDRDLHALPFEALPLSTGGPLVIDRFEVGYVPSSTFVQGQRGRRVIWPWQVNATIFADPTTATGSDGGLFPAAFPRLPGAREEADIIPRVLHARAETHIGADNLRHYVDPARLRGREVLHLATHGIADPEDPDRSRLVFSPEPNNERAQFLFAREIAALDLRQTSIVALASCDTEAGREVGGEGTAALSRAFLASGARSTVSSLWKVDDRSSVELMRRFYQRLAGGVPAGAALREAKLALKNSGTAYAHPRYWAPYVLNGDAGVRLGVQVRWWWIAAAAALLLLASFAALYMTLNGVSRRRASDHLYAHRQ